MVQHPRAGASVRVVPRPGPICRWVSRTADALMNAGTAAGGCPVVERLAADQLVTVSVVTDSGAMVSTSTGQLDRVPSASRGHDPVSLLCAPIGSLRLDSIISPTRAAGLLRRRSPLREVSHVTSVDEGGERVQLNQYRLQDAIGCGSYGVVKLAYNQDDDTTYAMKILNKKKIMQRAGMFVRGRSVPLRKSSGSGAMINPMERVYREIAVLKKLSHPNVVKLIEVLDDPVQDSLYLVFELLEKGPVLEIPTSSPLSEQLARKYIRDVVLGIEYLHHQKIIHRDIKPANLLLGDDGSVKIADFGVCNEFTGPDAYLTGTSGSPAFMPPEALQTQRDRYGGRGADLWAIGVTLFSLVTGQLPFSDDNIVALYHKIQTEEPAFPQVPALSDQLCELLRWMLTKDPQRRATLADVKQHSWLTLGGQMPLPSEQDNCRHSVEVTEDEVRGCVRHLPSINTVILMKTMFRNRSFLNPFRGGLDFRTRSNSAPSIVDDPQAPAEDPPPLTPVAESDDS